MTDILHNLSLTIGEVCDPELAEKDTVEYEDLVDAIHDFGEKTVEKFEESIDFSVEDKVEELKKELSVSYWKFIRKTALIEKERDKLKRLNQVLLWRLGCMKEKED